MLATLYLFIPRFAEKQKPNAFAISKVSMKVKLQPESTAMTSPINSKSNISEDYESQMKQLEDLCASEVRLQTEINALQTETQNRTQSLNKKRTELANLNLANYKLKTERVKPLGKLQVAQEHYKLTSEKHEAIAKQLKEIQKQHDALPIKILNERKKSLKMFQDFDINKTRDNLDTMINEAHKVGEYLLQQNSELLEKKTKLEMDLSQVSADKFSLNVDEIISEEDLKKFDGVDYEKEIKKMRDATLAVRKQIDFMKNNARKIKDLKKSSK